MDFRNRKRYIVLTLLLTLLLSGCGGAANPTPAATSAPAETPAPVGTEQPAVKMAEAPAAEPVEPTAEPTPEPTPETGEQSFLPGAEVPAMVSVEDSFFDDAAFFGNSLIRGLYLYGKLGSGDFIAETSASVVNVGLTKNSRRADGTPCTLLEKLAERQYGKIYVLLGVNEMGFQTDGFVSLYDSMLDEITAAEPNAVLYLMGLTPITAERDQAGDVFTREKAEEFNAAILELAERRGCYYLDLSEGLSDENGWLPAEESTDGIHFVPEKYLQWADYLRTHYVPVY